MTQIRVPGTDDVIRVPDDSTPEQWDQYIADFKQFQQENQSGGLFSTGVGKTVATAKRVGHMVQGDVDPREEGLPSYTKFRVNDRGSIDPAIGHTGGGEMMITDDEGFGNYLKKKLGPRFRGMRKDYYGQPIIKFVDQDGEEQEAYVNKPGLDMDDVNRGVLSSVPYMIASGPLSLAGSAIAKGAGLIGNSVRAAVQGTGQALTSVGQDVAGTVAGSGQAPDPIKAAWAGLGGAAGEVASGSATQFRDWMAQRGLFRNGELTQRGRLLVQQRGVDPDGLEADIARQWAKDRTTALTGPESADRKMVTESQGLRGTVGDYTQDVEQQILESNMERGSLGQEAHRVMHDFRRQQQEGVEKATSDYSTEQFGHGREVPAGAGEELQRGAKSKFAQQKAEADDAWVGVSQKRMDLDDDDREILAGYYRRLKKDRPEVWAALGRIDPQTQPAAAKALGDIEDAILQNAWGRTKSSKGLGFEGKQLNLQQLRTRLTQAREQAARSGNPADLEVTNAIADRYNEFVIHLGQATKDTSDALQMMKAVDLTEKLERTWGLKGGSEADKFMRDLIIKDATPENIVKRIFTESGRSGTASVPIIRRLKEVFGEDSPEWAIIRATAFDNLVTGGKGAALTAERLHKNAAELITRNSVYRELFDAGEIRQMERFFGDIRALGKKDLPSTLKSREMTELQRVRKDGVIRYVLRRMGTRETFQGQPFRGAIWHMLARSQWAGPMVNFKEAGGRRLAEQATRGKLPTKRPSRYPGFAGAGASASGQLNEREINGGGGW